ncbi:MAG: hypothetical protein AAGN35_07175 [Bacteroidota bacterium]
MGEQQLFQGILAFPNAAAFSAALAEMEVGTEEFPAFPDREGLQSALVSDTVLVLNLTQSPSAAQGEVGLRRLSALAKHAVRGRLVAVIAGDLPEVTVIECPASSDIPEGPVAVVDPESSFFPFYAGARYDYETRFEGTISSLWWTVHPEGEAAPGSWFSFPMGDSGSKLDHYLGGDAFCAVGEQLLVAVDFSENVPPASGQRLVDAGAAPGTVWLTHPPGSETLRTYRHLGFEDVAAPGQLYAGCLKVQLNDYFLRAAPSDYALPDHGKDTFTDHVSYLYFARGVGLVKIGFPDGEFILTGWHRDVDSAPPPPKRPTEGLRERKAVPAPSVRKKPWWKFW